MQQFHARGAEDADEDAARVFPRARRRQRRSIFALISDLAPSQQLGYGCLVVMFVGAATLYCVGAASMMVRPMLLERQSTPTALARPTLLPTPTQAAPTLIKLPGGTPLLPTPTQARIPTREPTTVTPTWELVNGTPVSPTPSPTGKISGTPTRRMTATMTPR